MSGYIRRGLLLAFTCALAACSGAGAGSSNPSVPAAGDVVAQALETAPDAGAGILVVRPMKMHPDATAPALIVDFVATGPNQRGVPCIGCVHGASTDYTIGLTGPVNYIPKGAAWQYALAFTDISYKGQCKISFVIAAGKKVLDSFSKTLTVSDGGFFIYGFARNRPSYSGTADVTGQYKCGSHTQSVKAPLWFE